MCFKITLDTSHSIAQEDIEVYKVGTAIGANFQTTLHKKYLYLRDTNQSLVELKPYNNTIEEGYHSYDLFTATKVAEVEQHYIDSCNNEFGYKMYLLPNIVVGKFIIPKGSEIYQNKKLYAKYTTTALVSNNIIYKEEIQWV